MGRKKKYFTEEEKKEANRLKQARWRERHQGKNLEKVVQWMNDNPILSRAIALTNAYKQKDKMYNRGECTLTAQWIIENIFTKPCHYCGVEGWDIIGCDRIDNDKPHTLDNVVPCCEECNIKRGRKTYDEFLQEMLEKKL